MTASKSKAAGKKPAAAQAEKNGKPPEFVYRGLKLTLPKKMGWRLTRSFAELHASNGAESVNAAFEFAEQLFGKDQVERIYSKFDEDEEDFETIAPTLLELFNAAFEQYGTDTGESSASPKS